MKRFIAVVALQEGAYNKVVYEATDCPEEMAYGATRVPLLPVLNASVEEGETIEVILIAAQNEKLEQFVEVKKENGDVELKTAFDRNLDWTREEILEWAAQKKVHVLGLDKPIIKDEPATMTALMEIFKELIKRVETNWSPEDLFYADVTFGQKVMSIVLLYLLRYIRAIKKNVIENIVYGQIYWKNKMQDGKPVQTTEYIFKIKDNTPIFEPRTKDVSEPKGQLHDVTALFYMDSLVSRVGEMDIKDPAKIISWSLTDAINGGDK